MDMSTAASPKVRAERIAIAGAAGLAVTKLGVGLATNSIGLLSAAADSLFDVAMSSFNLWSIRIADSPADEGHPFGHGKAENLAGLVQVVFIGLVGGALLAEAVRRLIQGTRPDHPEWGVATMAVASAVLRDRPVARMPVGAHQNRRRGWRGLDDGRSRE